MLNDHRRKIETRPSCKSAATTIDYSNFESHIHAKPEQSDKAAAYSKLWENLYELQG